MNTQASFKLFPFYFKFIGLTASFLSLLLAIYCKLMQTTSFLGVSLAMTQIIFACALLILLMTKDKFEDERSFQLRNRVLAPAYIFLTGWIIMEHYYHLEHLSALGTDTFALSVVITALILFDLEIQKNARAVEWTEKNKFLYSLIAVSGAYVFVRFSEWLWFS